MLPAFFDYDKNIWVATGDFSIQDMPKEISVDYDSLIDYFLDNKFIDSLQQTNNLIDWDLIYPKLQYKIISNTFNENNGDITGESQLVITHNDAKGASLCIKTSIQEVNQQYVENILLKTESNDGYMILM